MASDEDSPRTPFPAVRPSTGELPSIPPTSDPAILAVHMDYMRNALNDTMAVVSSLRDTVLDMRKDIRVLRRGTGTETNPDLKLEITKTKWQTLQKLGMPVATALASAFLAWASTLGTLRAHAQPPAQEVKQEQPK